MKRIKHLLRLIKESIWFYPIIYSFFALIIAIISISYDLGFFGKLDNYLPKFILMDLNIAETVLSIIGGAFITITTFTFSTTMVVLTMYTSQYSPRVVRNFLTQKDTLKSFGVFVSGFFYVMIILLLMSNYSNGSKIISATIGLVYVLVGLVFFFRFINSVASYIQASNLIKRLKENAIKEIDSYKKSLKEQDIVTEVDIFDKDNYIKVESKKDGYIEEFDYNQFTKVASLYNINIHIMKVVGQFVSKKTTICHYYAKDELNEEDKDDIVIEIQKGFIFGEQRSEVNDFEFSIQKIVEVALKALSPGINDPNTAIHCIRITSLLLRDLAPFPKGYIKLEAKNSEDTKTSHVYLEAMNFEILLLNTYLSILHYGKSDLFVVLEIIKALQIIVRESSAYNEKKIKEFTKFLWNKIIDEKFKDYEIELLKNEMKEIEIAYESN